MPNRKVLLVTLISILVLTLTAAHAQVLNSIISFTGNNGVNPNAGLILSSDGNFYGTTGQGGANGNYRGTVFEITPLGVLTTLHTFQGSPGDGAFPDAGLIQATDGFLYGATANGGTSSNCQNGCGTIFRISTDGNTYTVLHNFSGTDGAEPTSSLMQASDGNLYGTAQTGGTGNNCTGLNPSGCGTAFKLSLQGAFSIIHIFNLFDGYQPHGLLEGPDLNLYGTTGEGIASGHGCSFGCGTVYRMTKAGSLSTLHVFQGGADGFFPDAPLVLGTDQNFYGTTSNGGINSGCFFTNCGTVFRITSQGAITTASLSATTGSDPVAPLMLAPDGKFYGTTALNGANSAGTVFRLDPIPFVITLLYTFCAQQSCIDGSSPGGGLVRYTDGTYWGTTFGGGVLDEGIVFSLGPAVTLSPSSLDFGAQGINQLTAPQISTLINTSGDDMTISNITISGANSSDFSQTNNCPSTLIAGGSCQVMVVFSPTGVGTRTANVTITDNAVDNPQIISLTGIGVGGKVALR